MMSEVIEIGYYRDNVLLTYYAIDLLEKQVKLRLTTTSRAKKYMVKLVLIS